jgi:hypothetical protein
MFMHLAVSTLTAPLGWFVSCLALLALRRWVHPVGSVMLSSVASTVVVEGASTRFRYAYGSDDWAFYCFSSRLLAALIIGTVLATVLHFAFRSRPRRPTS